MAPSCGRLSAFIYNSHDPPNQRHDNAQFRSGTETSTTGALPEWITLASIYDWAEEANLDTLPVFKIPNLTANKITEPWGVYRRPRGNGALLQPGTLSAHGVMTTPPGL